MPRKPHFVLAARRWGWPLSPSYGRVRGLMTSVRDWKPKAETASCGFGSLQPGRAWRGTPWCKIKTYFKHIYAGYFDSVKRRRKNQ
jgi:hypothetical protein